MIPAIVVLLYLATVVAIDLFARRASERRSDAEDFFPASGHAFANGIVTCGLMASSSALIIPLSLFVIGTRLWAPGKRHGFINPVQMFRDRRECGHVGTAIFAVQALLLIPDIVIAVMTLISAVLMVVVSRLTAGSRPCAATLARYF
jgi:hypothetical protein